MKLHFSYLNDYTISALELKCEDQNHTPTNFFTVINVICHTLFVEQSTKGAVPMSTDSDHSPDDPETSPAKPAEESARTDPTPQTEPEAEEAVDAGSDLPITSDVSEVDLAAAQFTQERTSDFAQVEAQSESNPAAGTGTEPEADQLSEEGSKPSSHRAGSGESNTRLKAGDKRTPLFKFDTVQLGKIELKDNTDSEILIFDNVLHPCVEDDSLLQAKGIERLLRQFPPQGYMRKKDDVFVAVYDLGKLIERARCLLDETTPIHVAIYSSEAKVEPIPLRQLALYFFLGFTPTREVLRSRIEALHTSLLPDGSEFLAAPSKALLASVAGRRESALRPSEKGARRKRRPQHQELSAASDEPKKVG